jgi:hypothetical protein
MIRSIGIAVALVLLINLMAIGGFIGWLGASGRMDRDRLQAMVEMFSPTLEQERALQADADAAEAQAQQYAREVARLESVADGPRTLGDRLDASRQATDLGRHRVERLREDRSAIERRLQTDRGLLERQRELLDQQRTEFEQHVQQLADQRQSEDFRRAVQTLEQLPPGQAQQMVQTLVDAGQQDLAVEYLAAMQLRKSAAILREYQGPEGAQQATELVEALRQRSEGLRRAAGMSTGDRGDEESTG